jgi:hypothetical protein
MIEDSGSGQWLVSVVSGSGRSVVRHFLECTLRTAFLCREQSSSSPHVNRYRLIVLTLTTDTGTASEQIFIARS